MYLSQVYISPYHLSILMYYTSGYCVLGMGPNTDAQKSGLSFCPKLSRDAKSMLWEDAVGPWDEYAEPVNFWFSFHDFIPATNFNYIS